MPKSFSSALTTLSPLRPTAANGSLHSVVAASNSSGGPSRTYEAQCVYPSSAMVFVFGTMGLIGNFLLLCVMKRPHLRNKSYAHFLSALAISDNVNLLFLMFHMVNYISRMNGGMYLTAPFNNIGCKLFDFIERIFVFNSAWLIVCITVERFLVIYFPCRGRIFCRAKKALAIVIAVSVISCASQSFRLMWVIRDDKGLCSFDQERVRVAVNFDLLCELLLFYIVPSFTILILNVLTLIRMNGFIRSNSSTTVATLTHSTTNGTTPARGSLRNSAYYAAAVDNGGMAGTPVDTVNPQQQLLGSGRENCTASTSSGTGTGTGNGSAGTHQLLLKYFPRLRRNSRRATWILLTISFTYLVCCLPNLVGELYWHVRILVITKDSKLSKTEREAFYDYFFCYSFFLKIFKMINYGSNFYTYILFGKSFRKEVTTLLNFSTSSVAHPWFIGHPQPPPQGNGEGPVVMMRLPGAPCHGGIDPPPPDIILFNRLKSPHLPLVEFHNQGLMMLAEDQNENSNPPQRYRNMPEFPI